MVNLGAGDFSLDKTHLCCCYSLKNISTASWVDVNYGTVPKIRYVWLHCSSMSLRIIFRKNRTAGRDDITQPNTRNRKNMDDVARCHKKPNKTNVTVGKFIQYRRISSENASLDRIQFYCLCLWCEHTHPLVRNNKSNKKRKKEMLCILQSISLCWIRIYVVCSSLCFKI